jgi:3-deoxy-D-manno-octulosonic-acid transferase
MFDLIIVPTKNIKKIFKNSLQINNTHIIYDTRFDQVMHRKENSNEIPEFQLIRKDNIIFGSISWEDLEIISSILQNKSSNNITDGIIIVPHEIDLKLIMEIEKICQNSTSLSKVSKLSNLKENSNVRVIIVDKVGILPELYKYSRFAYVGGGFGHGVHSTIEPLVYNNIVCYGPNIDLLDEAKEMHQKGCGFIINNGIEFHNKYLESISPSETNNIRQNIQKYLDQKGSSAEKIYDLINKHV